MNFSGRLTIQKAAATLSLAGLLFTAATPTHCRAQQAQTTPATEHFSHTNFTPPAGWTRSMAGTWAQFTPPGLAPGKIVALQVSPGGPSSRDLTEEFGAFVKASAGGMTIVKQNPSRASTDPQGLKTISQTVIQQDAGGNQLLRYYVARRNGDRFEALAFTANDADLVVKYKTVLTDFLASMRFDGAPAPQGAAPAALPNQAAKPDRQIPDAPVSSVQLPALHPRPGYIIGRAVFANGTPIPNFEVSADSVAGSAGTVQGANGTYALRITDPRIFVVQHVRAIIRLKYQGYDYVLLLHPTDGRSDESTQGAFQGDVKRGVVRDFVFQLSGVRNGYVTNPPPAVTSTDSGLSASFHGCTLACQSMMGAGFRGSFKVTLTPTAPRIDGTAGKVIVRNFPLSYNTYLHDIPLGIYTATVTATDANGTTVAVHLKMQVYGTPVSSGDTPQSAVTIKFPPAAARASYFTPTLTMMP